MLCNHTSRYHVAEAAIRKGAFYNPKVAVDSQQKISYVLHLAQKAHEYIYANGEGACWTYIFRWLVCSPISLRS